MSISDKIIDIINKAASENKNLEIDLNDGRSIFGKPSSRLVRQGDYFNSDGFTILDDDGIKTTLTWDMIKELKITP